MSKTNTCIFVAVIFGKIEKWSDLLERGVGPQDCNGEKIFLIRYSVRELSRKYRKWPKIESNPLVFFQFSTFLKKLKISPIFKEEVANGRGEFCESKNVTHALRRPLILEI